MRLFFYRTILNVSLFSILFFPSFLCSAVDASTAEKPYTLTHITNGEQTDMYAEFSPDGKQIVYSSLSGFPGQRDFSKISRSYWNIRIMDADGKNKRQITSGKVSDLAPVFTSDGKKVIFSSNRGGGTWNIWSVGVDGSDLTPLTHDSLRNNYSPSVIPGNKGILFISNRWGQYSVALMDMDGKNPKRITSGGSGDWFPLMHPSEKEILFVSTRLAKGDLWTVDLEGKNYNRLTFKNFPEFSPAWNPDGTKIAYVSREGGKFDIWVMDRDGNNKKRLTGGLSGGNWDSRFSGAHLPQSAGYYHLSWHPNGKKIALITWEKEKKKTYISILELKDGALDNPDTEKNVIPEYTLIGETELTRGKWEDIGPCFSPDGKSIVFTSNKNGKWDIWRVALSNSGSRNTNISSMEPEQLTKGPSDKLAPVFSPDGTKIAFLSEIKNQKSKIKNSIYSLWVMKSNGGDQKPLIEDIPVLSYPAWSPDGTEIAFVSHIPDRKKGHEIWIYHIADGDRKRVASILNTSKPDLHASAPKDYPFKDFLYRIDYNASGNRITFESGRSGNIDIWTVKTDGTDPKRVTTGDKPHWNPVYSPDGKKLAYSTAKLAEYAGEHNWINFNIWMADAETGEEMVVTGEEQSDWHPAWSPDGKMLAYVTNRSGDYKHYSIWMLYLK